MDGPRRRARRPRRRRRRGLRPKSRWTGYRGVEFDLAIEDGHRHRRVPRRHVCVQVDRPEPLHAVLPRRRRSARDHAGHGSRAATRVVNDGRTVGGEDVDPKLAGVGESGLRLHFVRHGMTVTSGHRRRRRERGRGPRQWLKRMSSSPPSTAAPRDAEDSVGADERQPLLAVGERALLARPSPPPSRRGAPPSR